MKIKITEIFTSLSGEVGGLEQGSPTLFVRLAGCSLHCPFCDTKHANTKDAGYFMEVEDLAKEIINYEVGQLLITGGEPLEQAEAVQKLVYLLKASRNRLQIQIETNGTKRVDSIYLADYFVVDYKCPDAMQGIPYQFAPGRVGKNCWVKFLIGSREDFDLAVTKASLLLQSGCHIAFSPVVGLVEAIWMAERILESGLPITLNIQLHKIIGLM